jgi:hypothetical protein
MYASMFENGTLANWETRSVVVHATSSAVQGPYQIQKVVLSPRKTASPLLWDSLDCHNPTVHHIGNEYVIFYIGVGVNPSYIPSTISASRLGTDLYQSIGAAYSASPEGPWTRMSHPLLVPTEKWECGGGSTCGVSNPAIVLHSDGSVLMFYRGNNDRGIGVASAPEWRGPYTKQHNKTSIIQGKVMVGLEDMYVFENPTPITKKSGINGTTGGVLTHKGSSRRTGCHMVLHQEEAGADNIGGHAFTEAPDCITGWKLATPIPSRAYGPEFKWDNGSTSTFASRERPQIVLGEGGWPMYLSNGIITTGWSGRSFTLVAPINASA